ncbi:MAG: outer rane hemin/siderophore receptor protein [Massilia sp.]|nr:outer rane hemin/siderophore receptor protein [Massilia sp.]
MFSTVSKRSHAVRPLVLAAIVSSCFAHAAHAQSAIAATDLPTVLVTGSRFANPVALAPIGATVISAEDIRRAGATDVNQAIRKVGGVFGRQSLDASPDFSLDLRGFGSNSAQNMVVLVDGVRLSENELSNPVLSTIPIDTVERIEIVRGGSSVLYGDGATGGVIQIVTKRGGADQATRGSLSLEAGTLRSHDARASVAGSFNGFNLDAAIDNQATDNSRANSRFQGTSFSGGAQYALGAGRIGLRVDSARQKSRFPGSLTQAQFDADADQSLTPNDFGSLDSDRISAFAEQRFGAFDAAAELSYREKTVKAHYVSDFGFGPSISDSQYDTEQTQFSPRLRHRAQYGTVNNELVGGIDLLRWKRTTRSDFSAADARQDSKAFYVRDELRFGAAGQGQGQGQGRIALGARHETFDKDYSDALAFPLPANDHSSQSLRAWDLQGSYAVLPALTVHAKAGQSYRLATADENSFRSSSAILQPQTSHDLELGATWAQAGNQLSARVFRHRLVNEIYYDPTIFVNGFAGANTNLDPTERRGVEIDGQWRLAADWTVSAHAQHLKATFTEGVNSGRSLTLVPKNVVSARLGWSPASGSSADLGAQWVDSQRFGSDFANSCTALIPSHTTFDGRVAQRVGKWEFALAGTNLADKQFYSNAFSCRAGIYPENGRQLKLSARYDF